MGRPPKPIERHRLVGSYREDRHGTDHPHYEPSAPDAPAWMLPAAREVWAELVPMLVGGGVMAPPHAMALALLCNTMVRYREASDLIDREGAVVETANGPKRHPGVMVLNKLHDQVMQGLREFGLTPVSVNKVSATPPPPAKADDMDSILRLADQQGGRDE